MLRTSCAPQTWSPRRTKPPILVTVGALLLVCANADDKPEGLPEPIDFEAAWAAATASVRHGQTVDEAMELADRVIQGERRFVPVDAPCGGGHWLRASDWLSESDARLLQHEIITTKGWVTQDDNHRTLVLREPLPAWASDLAERIAPALNGQPNACEVIACEASQTSLPIDVGRQSQAAILSLAGPADLMSGETHRGPIDMTSTDHMSHTELQPRAMLLLADVPAHHMYRITSRGSRHLSVVLHKTTTK